MISAPSHQQPLNGNKKLWLLILPVLLFSCGAFTSLPGDSPIVVHPLPTADTSELDHPDDNPPVDVPADETRYQEVFFHGESFRVEVHKQEFHIALILPFHQGYKNNQQQRRADLMLEYYQGVRVALEKLREMGSTYTLHVFDSKNDSLVVKRILRKAEMKKMDLIIGPTDQSQLDIAARFAQKHKIPLFSPISVAKLVGYNPYVYNLKSSPDLKAKEFVAFYQEYHSTKKLVLVRDGGRFNRDFGAALVRELDASAISYQAISGTRDRDWSAVLNAESNMVVLLSEDKSNVSAAVTGMMASKKDIHLFGSERWLDFNAMDYSFWLQLNVHLICSDRAQVNNPLSIEMRKQFRSMFNGDPSGFAYSGYDQMLFAGQLLHAFGEHFPLFVLDHNFEYSNTNFKLRRSGHCMSNSFLYILAFKDHKLEAVDY
ncbi:MAG: amino acid ABC transporter substrate-binding protein [Bacteroidia bacterium]